MVEIKGSNLWSNVRYSKLLKNIRKTLEIVAKSLNTDIKFVSKKIETGNLCPANPIKIKKSASNKNAIGVSICTGTKNQTCVGFLIFESNVSEEKLRSVIKQIFWLSFFLKRVAMLLFFDLSIIFYWKKI